MSKTLIIVSRIRRQICDFSAVQVLDRHSARVFAKMEFTNCELPTAYRTYHPGYMSRWPDYYADIKETLIGII